MAQEPFAVPERRVGQQLLHEPRLADPGLPFHEGHGRAAGRGFGEQVQLRLTLY